MPVELQTLEQGRLVIYSAYALLALAVFIVARMLLEEQEARAAQENLEELQNREASNGLVRLTRPLFSQYVVPMLRGKSFWDKKRKYYRVKLVAAGLRDELTPDEFIAFKLFLILFFPLTCGFLKVGGFFDFAWYTILGSGVLGWFYPDLWMRSKIQARQKEIKKAMPFVVDLLALSTEAGLDFIGAISRVVEKADSSPLIQELEQLLKEIKVGSSRQEALREMANRIDMPEMNSFVAVLISSDQMGASIGKVLRQQSEEIRNQRFLAAEKAGAAASQKLILPIVLIVLPAVMLMVAAPFVLTFLQGT